MVGVKTCRACREFSQRLGCSNVSNVSADAGLIIFIRVGSVRTCSVYLGSGKGAERVGIRVCEPPKRPKVEQPYRFCFCDAVEDCR